MNYGIYDHHGVYCGHGEVIHFGRGIFDIENAIVEIVDLDTFSGGNQIKVQMSNAAFEPDEIVNRARQKLGETGYELLANNCEHFVNWCRSGEHESRQVNVSETVARQSTAIFARPMLRKSIVKIVSQRIGTVSGVMVARTPTLVACFADVVQASVEIVATNRGKSKKESRHIGQQAGLASSATLGFVVGGPLIAAAGVGFWATGQVLANQTDGCRNQAMSTAVGHATSCANSTRTWFKKFKSSH